MKPRFLFALTFVFLIGGTLVSRYAIAGGVSHTEYGCGGTLSRAQWDALQEEPMRVVRLKEPYACGKGERPALQRIAQELDDNPDAPFSVIWTETFHHKTVKLRAYYLPQSQTLICTSGELGLTYAYQPMTRAGIDAGLRDGSTASFASANIYSSPGVSPP